METSGHDDDFLTVFLEAYSEPPGLPEPEASQWSRVKFSRLRVGKSFRKSLTADMTISDKDPRLATGKYPLGVAKVEVKKVEV